MKKAFSILLILSLVFMAVACKSAPAAGTSGPVNIPPWLNDSPPEDVIWGIGVAKQSSVAFSMETAQARGRVAVARQLNTKVQAMFVDYNLDAGNVNNQANTSLQENVSRQITDQNVSGVRQREIWPAPDGTFWCLMEMKKSDAKASVASILGNEQAAFAQFKTQQALQYLDSQLAKNDPVLQVNN